MYSNINGKIIDVADAAVAIDNGSFRYGYGLFETMLVRDGVLQLGQYHRERLFAGIAQLQLHLPRLVTAATLEDEVLRTVAKNKPGRLCRVRLQVYAGGGGLFGPESNKAGFVIECWPLDPEIRLLNENGLTAGIAAGLAKSMDAVSNLKSCNALIYAMAARQAKERKWNDALVCNTAGNIIESTIANIFWIKGGTVFTPPLSEGCVAGVMRRHVMHILGTVQEKILDLETLLQADEVFLTNAIRSIKWVSMAADSKYSNKQIKSIYSML